MGIVPEVDGRRFCLEVGVRARCIAATRNDGSGDGGPLERPLSAAR